MSLTNGRLSAILWAVMRVTNYHEGVLEAPFYRKQKYENVVFFDFRGKPD
jgi:hypothetical protein